MPYPLIIKDDFFEDPDSIVKIARECIYSEDNFHNYPGVRSKSIDEINPKLYVYILQKIFLLFHDKIPTNFKAEVKFQKIKPFVEGDKWDKKNTGWVHRDNSFFSGVIYLDKNPDKDAGTSMYKSNDGYDVITDESIRIKEDHYAGKEIDDEEFNKGYDIIADQYEETLRIPNLYNRLVLIPGDQPHSITTTGDKERNTIVFFCDSVSGVFTPEYKGQNSAIPNHALYT